MIRVDGSEGEGGGQIVRTSLALSMVTGEPVRIEEIRAGRPRPGLMRQHLTALNAAVELSSADVEGNTIGSREVVFRPRSVRPGDYRFSVGTAGSTGLVLQTLLPALATANETSTLLLEGGTHNPKAPPFDYLSKTFLPVLERFGVVVASRLERHGFYPAGGGRVRYEIRPTASLSRVELVERGELRRGAARAVVSALSRHIAKRELAVVLERLGWERTAGRVETIEPPVGPGNVVTVDLETESHTEVFTGFGEKGLPAETVAERLASEVSSYLAAGAPVGPYLADQLILWMALAGGGVFETGELTPHTRSQLELVPRFLAAKITCEPIGGTRARWRVAI